MSQNFSLTKPPADRRGGVGIGPKFQRLFCVISYIDTSLDFIIGLGLGSATHSIGSIRPVRVSMRSLTSSPCQSASTRTIAPAR